MTEYITRNAAYAAACDGADNWDGGCNPSRDSEIAKEIATVPAQDVAPVVHAYWTFGKREPGLLYRACSDCRCSNCGSVRHLGEPMTIAKARQKLKKEKYCYHCGALMDLKEEESDD